MLPRTLVLAALLCGGAVCPTRAAHHPRRHRATGVRRPVITKLEPPGFTTEMGPDFHYDSTHHGAADNPTEITLTVRGRGFRRGARVRWDSKVLVTKFVSTARLEGGIRPGAFSRRSLGDGRLTVAYGLVKTLRRAQADLGGGWTTRPAANRKWRGVAWA